MPGLVTLMGCAQLFGIDNTSGPAAQPDAPGPSSSLTVDRYSVGATIVQAPQDLSQLTAAQFFASDEAIPGTVTAANAWSVPADSTSVQFELPDFPTPIQRTLALPDETMSTLFGVLEHPNPTPAPAPSSIAISVTLPTPIAAGESYQVHTLGSWTQFVMAGPDIVVGGTALSETYDFATSTSITGRPLEAITPDDAVLLLRFAGDQLTGALVAPPYDQVANPSGTITGTLAAVQLDQTLSAAIDPATALARMGSAQPAPTATSTNWSLVAAPGYAIASTSGVLLNAAAAAPTDTSVAATYTSQFMANDWHPVFTWAPTGSHVSNVAFGSGTLPVTTFTQLVDFMDASTGPLSANLPAGQPLAISLAGTPLVTDALAVPLDVTQRLDVSFTADVADNTLYQVDVFLLVPNDPTTPTAYVFQNVMAMTGVTADFTIPANTLQVGSSYVIRAVCLSGGFPAVATGDLTQRALPLAEGLLDSGAFTVTAP
jgi:hypothetical protein